MIIVREELFWFRMLFIYLPILTRNPKPNRDPVLAWQTYFNTPFPSPVLVLHSLLLPCCPALPYPTMPWQNKQHPGLNGLTWSDLHDHDRDRVLHETVRTVLRSLSLLLLQDAALLDGDVDVDVVFSCACMHVCVYAWMGCLLGNRVERWCPWCVNRWIGHRS